MRCDAMRCLAVAFHIGLSLLAFAKVEPYQVVSVDYLANEPLTGSSVWLNADPGQFSSLEYPGETPGVAWKRSTGTRSVSVVFLYPGPYEHDATLTMSTGVYASASGSFNITSSPSAQTLHFTPGGTATANFTISGLPNFVTLGPLNLPFTLISSYTGISGSFDIKIWLLDASPIGAAPGHQVPVWAEVLDKACLWCTGLVGPADCRVACTYGVYGSAGIYEGTIPDYYNTATHRYRLKLFVDTPGWNRFVNCEDVAGYFAICNAAIGVPTSLKRVTSFDYNFQIGFRTHPIRAVGLSSYSSYNFQFHAQASSTGTDVFDACAAQLYHWDLSFWDKPIDGWSRTNYWQTSFYTSGLAAGWWTPPGNYLINPVWSNWNLTGLE